MLSSSWSCTLQEVYGEDPYLSGQIAAAYVRGLQGSHPRFIVASSGCKVVDVHSGPEDIPVSRLTFNAVVSGNVKHAFDS